MIKLFYYDALTDQGQEGEESKVATELEVITYFKKLSTEEGTFIGIFKGEDDTLQFGWLRDDIWIIDIPIVSKQGSYQKEGSREECIELIKEQYKNFDLSFSHSYTFEEW